MSETKPVNQGKRTGLIVLALVVFLGLVVGGYFLYRHFAPATAEGAKTITVVIDDGSGQTRTETIHTDAEYLGAALLEKKLVEGTMGDYGLMITTVGTVTADESQQQWWSLTKGGEMLMTGADTTPIADGETFEITLKTGYDSF